MTSAVTRIPRVRVANWLLLLLSLFVFAPSITLGGAIVRGFNPVTDIRNDDGTWTAPNGCTAADDGASCPGTGLDLGFTANFFGTSFSQLYVNTNGSVTFDGPLAAYTPFALSSMDRQIIAPFFADVDTRNPMSGTTTFGWSPFDGRRAFRVNWIDVGYYHQRADKLNSFQLILVDRSDTGAGNFDIVFNYDSIRWETGEATTSGGVNGLGGRSARVGYSNGITQTYELPGSGLNGALLDGGINSLATHSLNSDVAGRYIFFARNGEMLSNVPEPTSLAMVPFGAAVLYYLKRRRRS